MTDRPLITFALFAYNQEKFIREAVEGAFAQTYSPLEIILSDDCSSDGTFQIMQEMVASYGGPHHVIAQKTPLNAGIWAHVMNVVNKSKGALIVLSAGDDISLSYRVSRLHDAWQKTGAWGLYSYLDRIDEDGSILEKNIVLKMQNHLMRSYFHDGANIQLIHGATSAYDRQAFSMLEAFYTSNFNPIFTEDGVMSFFLNINEKKIVCVKDNLVRYRAHSGSLSNNSNSTTLSKSDIVNSERKSAFAGERFVNLILLFLALVDNISEKKRVKIRRSVIESDLLFYEMLSRWTTVSTFERLLFLAKSRRWKDVRWMLPRLFGIKVFACTKYMLKKFL